MGARLARRSHEAALFEGGEPARKKVMSTLLERRVEVVGERGGGGERERDAEWPWLEFVDADQRLT